MSTFIEKQTEHKISRVPRRGMLLSYFWFGCLFALGVVIQVFLAGAGIFAAGNMWPVHAMFGSMLALFPIVLFILALVGRLPKFATWSSVILFVLVGIQSPLIAVPQQAHAPIVSALHPVNAMAIFALIVVVDVLIWKRVRATAE